MLPHFNRSAFLYLLLFFFSYCKDQKSYILGTWYFDRYGGPHGEISQSPKIVEANNLSKGLMITFTRDNKMIFDQPGRKPESTATEIYQMPAGLNQIICGGDTLKIMLLTSEILELYPKDEMRPALYLKRSKDGKTAMSAP
jgi:hypothetical protein